MYAVVATGGKQHKVAVGDSFLAEKIDAAPGDEVRLEQVLAISDDERGLIVGRPYVAGAAVVAKVTRQARGPKIIVFKYKPKKRYRRRTGHRQAVTQLLVREIVPGAQAVAEA